MKKALSLLLALVMCLSLCACGNSDDRDLLLGTWEVKNDALEIVYVFNEKEGKISGSASYYHFADKQWMEDTFTVKERTDSVITLLNDDGTISELGCYVFGDRMYLDGTWYTNKENSPPKQEDHPSTLIKGNEPYFVYENVFLGMGIEDVRKEIPFSDWQMKTGEDAHRNYEYYLFCDYYVDISDTLNEGVSVYMGFDQDMKLVCFETSSSDDPSSCQSQYQTQFTADFGQPELFTDYQGSDWGFYTEEYYWTCGDFRIKLTGDRDLETNQWQKVWTCIYKAS